MQYEETSGSIRRGDRERSASPRGAVAARETRLPDVILQRLQILEAKEHKERLLIQVDEGLHYNQLLTVKPIAPKPVWNTSTLLSSNLAYSPNRAHRPRPHSYSSLHEEGSVTGITPIRQNGSSAGSPNRSRTPGKKVSGNRHTITVPAKLIVGLNAQLMESEFRFLMLELEKSHQLLLLNASRGLYRTLCQDYAVLAAALKSLSKRNQWLELLVMGRVDTYEILGSPKTAPTASTVAKPSEPVAAPSTGVEGFTPGTVLVSTGRRTVTTTSTVKVTQS